MYISVDVGHRIPKGVQLDTVAGPYVPEPGELRRDGNLHWQLVIVVLVSRFRLQVGANIRRRYCEPSNLAKS